MTNPSQAIKAGDNVSFTITVTNQGTIPATGVEVTDYIPSGLSFVAASNPTWTAGTGTAKTTIASVPVGQSKDVVIVLQVASTAAIQGTTLINRAEISATADKGDGGQPITDIDSKPDTDVANDAGGVPNSPTDDKLDGNGTDDEDDADPAQITIQKYDLALIKKLKNAGQVVKAGDNVPFIITVSNQGTIPANGIQVTDYIPTDMIFVAASNPTWTAVGTNQATTTVAGPLAAGTSTTVEVILQVVSTVAVQGKTLVNRAEISGSADKGDNGTPVPDVDSKPDTNVANDAATKLKPDGI
jgi:uncharacterized repeat protein (TIGR01451 family)